MAVEQKYGIKYPFTNENEDNYFVDVNDSYSDWVKSRLLHVLFTPKGQKIRDPEFGTNLIRYIHEPNDNFTLDDLKMSLKTDINNYVKEAVFLDISIANDENSENGKIVIVHYQIKRSNTTASVAVKI